MTQPAGVEGPFAAHDGVIFQAGVAVAMVPKAWKHEQTLEIAERLAAQLNTATTLSAALAACHEERTKAVKALEAIRRDPHGCRFCDSGKLRTPNNPAKDHDTDCGFHLLNEALDGTHRG